jgi:hypothetical protein
VISLLGRCDFVARCLKRHFLVISLLEYLKMNQFRSKGTLEIILCMISLLDALKIHFIVISLLEYLKMNQFRCLGTLEIILCMISLLGRGDFVARCP